jgi:nucleolin
VNKCKPLVLGIKWFEEKDTRKFLGAGVVEFDTPAAAMLAVKANMREVNGRETKIRSWEDRGRASHQGLTLVHFSA